MQARLPLVGNYLTYFSFSAKPSQRDYHTVPFTIMLISAPSTSANAWSALYLAPLSLHNPQLFQKILKITASCT
jgi:hypothetical protein